MEMYDQIQIITNNSYFVYHYNASLQNCIAESDSNYFSKL